jgi:hypothetical protein
MWSVRLPTAQSRPAVESYPMPPIRPSSPPGSQGATSHGVARTFCLGLSSISADLEPDPVVHGHPKGPEPRPDHEAGRATHCRAASCTCRRTRCMLTSSDARHPLGHVSHMEATQLLHVRRAASHVGVVRLITVEAQPSRARCSPRIAHPGPLAVRIRCEDR